MSKDSFRSHRARAKHRRIHRRRNGREANAYGTVQSWAFTRDNLFGNAVQSGAAGYPAVYTAAGLESIGSELVSYASAPIFSTLAKFDEFQGYASAKELGVFRDPVTHIPLERFQIMVKLNQQGISNNAHLSSPMWLAFIYINEMKGSFAFLSFILMLPL